MDTGTLIAVIVVALIVLGVVWFLARKQRSAKLQERFGPEYERAVSEFGGRGQAESELEARRKRVEQLSIRPLSGPDRERFANAWRSTQAQFVDDPSGAIAEADKLVADLMQTRGYPVGDFEQRAADVSVNHPNVVTNYRAAHLIALNSERGAASTEDLRQAMMHYKALFEDLLETGVQTGGDSDENGVRRSA